MRKSIPFFSLFAGSILLTNVVEAQENNRFAYAVTDMSQQGSSWQFLRKLNTQTGEYGQVLLNGNDASYLAFDAATKKQIAAPLTDQRYGTAINAAFGTNVAAMAYDSRNDRLYYTPMLIDQLRYIDLKTMKVFYVTDRAFSGKSEKSPDQGNIITRMVIASDGNGYAMTNDGTQLLRFSTGRKLQVTDLGSVVDDQANKGISVHNSCSSFGGDMIADDNGNLYVFSARNHVFKINIESKIATHLGSITGLPAGFTVNGAAVNDKNQVIVASAAQAISLFTVDPKTWAATALTAATPVFHSSDLANGNLLVSGSKPTGTNPELMGRNISPNVGDGKINIYPNPVINNEFVVRFNQLETGNYTLQVTDVTGRQVVLQAVNIAGENQAQTVKLSPAAARGFYLVKVTDQVGKTVFSTKVVVQ